jgi:serine/threonine-protein kinase
LPVTSAPAVAATVALPTPAPAPAPAPAKPAPAVSGPVYAVGVNGGPGDPAASAAAGADGPDTPADSNLGRVLDGKYRLEQLLGAGGMGAVYRARHTYTGKLFAVKILHPEMSLIDEVAKRFEREARAASKLDHPNVIQVTDFGRAVSAFDSGSPGSGPQLYLVMEYLEGQSLGEAIDSAAAMGRRMPLARVLSITRQMLSALSLAHSVGIVHRDLKPDNVLLVRPRNTDPALAQSLSGKIDASIPAGGDDVVKILDFGIARMTSPDGDKAEAEPALTQAGVVFGTPEYLSPEQALGQTVDGRADIYSMGVILYEMLTGKKPFMSENRVQILSMHLSTPPRPPRAVAPDAGLSPALELVVLKALAKKREDRYATASDMLAALAQVPSSAYVSELSQLPIPAASGEPRIFTSIRTQAVRTAERVQDTLRGPGVGRLLRSRGVQIGGGAVVLLALVAVGLVLRGRGTPAGGETPAPAGQVVAAPAPPPEPPPADVEATLRQVEGLVASQPDEAVKKLSPLLKRNPKHVRLRMVLAGANLQLGRHAAAVDHFAAALALDPTLADNVRVLTSLRTLALEGSARVAAVTLLGKVAGEAARPLLVRLAKKEPDPAVRAAAQQALPARAEEPGEAGEDKDRDRDDGDDDLPADLPRDRAGLEELLKEGKTCKRRRLAVLALRELADPEALPALEKAQKRYYREFIFTRNANQCLLKDAKKTIKHLRKIADKRGTPIPTDSK